MQRDRGIFRRALELSLLLHLLLIFMILPRARAVWSAGDHTVIQLVPDASTEERPLRFEFVDLADDREEKPREDRPAPLSDMDRRAHGGEGDPSDRPDTRGSTPQLVQADGGTRLEAGTPPQPVGPQTVPVPQPEQEPEPERREPPEPEIRVEPEGAGDERPDAKPPQPVVRLPPPGQWALPPEQGGERHNPDRRGGQVDAGGLSFDTQWYDWGPYAKRMLAKIRRNWRIPEIARLGVRGVVKIRFFIERDGTVTGLRIIDESGKPPMDFAGRDAIAHSSAFEPLPTDLTGVEREGVTITFYYNLHPPEWDGR